MALKGGCSKVTAGGYILVVAQGTRGCGLRLLRGLFTILAGSALALALPAHAERVQNLSPTKAAPGGERRVALVIGNGAYKGAALRNPVNDARAMARALAEAGFAVTLGEDLNRAGMNRAIREFGDSLARGGAGLFYFAGHGMQVRNRNFLIPVDVQIEREDEIEYNSVDANQVLSKMDSAKNSTNIVILDACRNNPFARSFKLAATGLAQMDAPSGTLIAFATAPGQVAFDGEGEHGVYTKHLLAQIRNSGVPVELLFKQVRNGVMADTNERQVPWESSSLRGEFFFLQQSPQAMAEEQQRRQKEQIDSAVTSAMKAANERAEREREERERQLAQERAELQKRMEQLVQEALARQRASAQTVSGPLVPEPASAAPPPAIGSAASQTGPRISSSVPVLVATARPTTGEVPLNGAAIPRTGDRWEYETKDLSNRKLARQSIEVSNIDPRGIQERVAVDDGSEFVLIHGPGLYLSGAGLLQFSPYLLAYDRLERIPEGEIALAQFADCSGPRSCSTTSRLMGKESITVPAGTFDTTKVHVDILVRNVGASSILGTGQIRLTIWYAHEARRVVKVVGAAAGGTQTPNFETTLQSYKLN
jgi:uncharacterized caspase-like protein